MDTLDTFYDEETQQWVASYAPMQVAAVGATEGQARVACVQAIWLWMESCAERGTLAAAYADLMKERKCTNEERDE